MSEKKARAHRHALRRSHENTRLQRKQASVERSEHEREFDRLMSEARKERADAIESAHAAYVKAEKKAAEERHDAVRAADAAYIEKRDVIIRRLAGRVAA